MSVNCIRCGKKERAAPSLYCLNCLRAAANVELTAALGFVATLNLLRANEGSAVTLCCDNPEGNGTNNAAVEVADEWTNWQPRRFYASTIFAAAEAAIVERSSVEQERADWLKRPGVCRRCGGTWPTCCRCPDDTHWNK